MRAGRREALSRARADLVGGAVAALLTSGLVVLRYRLWETRPGISWSYEGDGLSYQTTIQGVLEGHWAMHNDRLGYPFGQHTSAYPLPDHLSLALVKVLGLVTGAGSAPVTNLYFFATFPLVAVAGYAALRWLGTRRDVSVVLAVLYAFAPYHLDRGAGHLFLSFYVFVPLATAALIRQLTGGAAFVDTSNGRFGRGTKSAWAAVVIAAGLALTGVYYALLFCVIAAGVALLLALRGRAAFPAAATTLGLALVTVVVLGIALVPSLVASDGTQVERSVSDSETYGLRVARLVLPRVDHRFDALASPAEELRGLRIGPNGDGTAALGAVAAVGFVAALLLVLSGRGMRDTQGAAATVVVLATIVGAMAGLGLLAAALGFTEIRAWNRISIFIAFASLVIVAGWLDRVLSRRAHRPWVAPLALTVLLVVGLFDQVPTYDLAARERTIETWQRDEGFFRAMEAELPHAAAVFQLPAVPYPEEPSVGDMIDYDHLRGYVHTDALRWSYGYARLSDPPWDQMLVPRPTRELVTGVALAGFDAIYLNRAGYVGTPDPDAVVRELTALLGEPFLRTADSQLLVWDTRPLRDRLGEVLEPSEVEAAGGDVLDLVSVIAGEGFHAREFDYQWLDGEDGELVVENRTSEPVDVRVRLELSGITEGQVELRAGSLVRRVDVVPQRRSTVVLPLEVEPGTSAIEVRTDVRRPEELKGEVRNITVRVFTPVVDAGTDLAALADLVGLP